MSVSLSQATNLAPIAQVVVYTLMPSGEAVADSQNFPIQLCLNNKVAYYHIEGLGRYCKSCILDWDVVDKCLPPFPLLLSRCRWSSPPSRSFQQRRQHWVSRLNRALCALSEPLTRACSCCRQSKNSLSTMYASSQHYFNPCSHFINTLHLQSDLDIVHIFSYLEYLTDLIHFMILSDIFVQMYSKLPLQKLSGYFYDVEDFEPYPCFTMPIPEPELEPEPQLELDPELEVTPSAPATDAQAARRTARSVYYRPNNQKNDVYSIFKVEIFSFPVSLICSTSHSKTKGNFA